MRIFNLLVVGIISTLFMYKLYSQNILFNEVKMKEKLNTKFETNALKFVEYFNAKDALSIGALLHEDFKLFDPKLKWVKGKSNVVDVLTSQFSELDNVKYEIIRSYQDRDTTILEFKIILDDLILNGVDFIKWEKEKMKELRCYYNPTDI